MGIVRRPQVALSRPVRRKLLDPTGTVIDRSMEHASRKEFRLHVLIGPVVTGVTVESTKCMSVAFANGYTAARPSRPRAWSRMAILLRSSLKPACGAWIPARQDCGEPHFAGNRRAVG